MPRTGASYSGGTHFQGAKGTGVKNNGATVLYAGNATTTGTYPFPNITNSLGSAYLGYHSGMNGAIIPGPFNPVRYIPNRSVTTAISGGTYATMTAGKYVIVRVSTTLAGLANTVLQTGAADFGRLPYNAFGPKGYIRTVQYILTGGWNYTTGAPINKISSNDVLTFETFPTRAIPGRILFRVNGGTSSNSIVKTNYAAKTD